MANESGVKHALGPARYRVSETKLRRMIEDATVDAYGEAEQVVGFLTMLEEHPRMPFEAAVLGVPVTVRRVDLTDVNVPPPHACRRTGDRLPVYPDRRTRLATKR